MKRIILLMVMLVVMCFSAHAQVQVGTGTNTSQYIPFSPYSAYSYSQTIYYPSEISASGTITGVQWYYTGGTGKLAKSQSIDIYIGTTDKNSFSSKSDWVPAGELTKVATAKTITTDGTAGWVTITFDDGFAYDGLKNLVIAVDENNPGGDAFGEKFRNTASTTGTRSIAYYGATNQDPTAPTDANGTVSFFPNVIFNGISQGCPAPFNLTPSLVTTNSATVSWDTPSVHPSGESEYYRSTSNVPPTSSTPRTGTIAVNQFSVALTNLDPATKYYVWIRHNCGGTYSNWSDGVSFTTLCPEVTKFKENFDGVTTPALPVCWSKIIRGGSICPSAAVQTQAVTSSGSQPNALTMFNCNSTGNYDIIAVSPILSNLGAGTNRLRLRAYGNGNIIVGTLNTNDKNTAVFFPVQTIEDLTSTFKEYIIPVPANSRGDKYIGIRCSELNPQQNTIYIDDVVWEFIPSCGDVSNLNVSDVTGSSAVIGWDPSSSGEGHWDIAWAPSNVLDPSNLPYVRTADCCAYTAAPLAATTNYNAWVRSVCDGVNGEGSWIGPIAFKTTCASLTDFSEDFNSASLSYLPYCWSNIIRPNAGTIANGSAVAVDGAASGGWVKDGNYVKLKNNGSIGNYDLILVSPPVSNLYAKNHRLKFWVKFPGAIEIGTLDSNTGSAVFKLYKTVTTLAGLNEYVINFSTQPTVTGQQFIAFRLPNSAGEYGGIWLDNIVWEPIPACPEVTGLTVKETSVSGAVMNWTPFGTENSWQMVVGSSTVTNPDSIAQVINVPGTNVTGTTAYMPVGGLASGTFYNAWVRAACGAKGNGAWVGPVTFLTECTPVASFSEGFDSVYVNPNGPRGQYSTDDLPPCWTKILRGGQELSQFAYIVTMNANTAERANFTVPNYVQINRQGSSSASDVILVSPAVSTLGQAYRLTFDYSYSAVGSEVVVGVLDGNSVNANFYPWKTIKIEKASGRIFVDFTTYDGVIRDNMHIGIKNPGADNMNGAILNIDNINWEPVPLCADIDAPNVTFTTPTSVTVTWQKAGSEIGWDIAVHPSNPNAADVKMAHVFDPNPTSITINDLTPGTTYYVWVRSVCSGNKYGGWSLPYSFPTPCTAADTPYLENFATANSGGIPACTRRLTDGMGSFWQTSYTAGNYGFIGNNMRCYSSDPATNAWFFTRGVNLEQGKTYRMSYIIGTSSPVDIGACQIPCGPVNLKVMLAGSQTVESLSTTLKDYVGLAGQAKSDFVEFTVPTTGVYYFCFNNYSEAGHGSVSIDDIYIDGTLANEEFDLSKLEYYPNPVKDVLTISNSKEISSVTVLNILGQTILQKNINASSGSVDMSSLERGTYLLQVQSDNLVKTVKIIKE